MRERPILFSGPMVRAILDGRKTQTRRVVKPQPQFDSFQGEYGQVERFWFKDTPWDPEDIADCCPYGQPGDRLWVRETWCEAWDDKKDCLSDPPRYHFRADGYEVVHVDDFERSPWRPSIHMPRRACRLLLEVTDVRIERLQAIIYEDALAEGVMNGAAICESVEPGKRNIAGETAAETARRLRWPQRHFEILWDSINGAGAWDANPWVWAISFKRMEATTHG